MSTEFARRSDPVLVAIAHGVPRRTAVYWLFLRYLVQVRGVVFEPVVTGTPPPSEATGQVLR